MREGQDQHQGPQDIVPPAPLFELDPQPDPPETEADVEEQQHQRRFAHQDEPVHVEPVKQVPALVAAQGHQRRMQQQQDSRKGPHAAMERKGQIEAEGPFHPAEPGGQHDLQDDDGKGQ